MNKRHQGCCASSAPRILALAVLLALGACGSCGKGSSSPLHCPGGEGCVCTVESPCDATLTCGAAGACEACVDGKAGCACLASGACDSGLACQGNLCAVCQPGAEGCACGDGSTCSAGLSCQAGLCVSTSCADGTTDCACDAGGTCGGGMVCVAGICRSCASDAPGCACDAGGACLGLVCESGTCRAGLSCSQAGCAPHQSCAPGSAAQDATCLAQCAPGFTWNTPNRACDPTPGATCALGVTGSIGQACAELFRPCVSTAAGAECGDCLEGYVEEDGACRAGRTCDALGCAAQHLTCTPPAPHADASCGACEAGYVSSNGACVLDPTLTCVALQPQCEALHMECVGAAAGASCQGCKPGYILDPTTAVCRPPYSCAILDTLPTKCDKATERCIEATAASDAFCRVPCLPCNGPGEDGAYPQYTLTHRCICQTKPGYFYTLANQVGTFPCDADGDGWTRDTARFAITSDDPVIRANARCGLRTIDRFVLHNEIGQTQTIHLDLQGGLPLYESARNDEDILLNAVAGSPQLPSYGPDRTLAAAELNSLTKACVGELADHNDNKVSDVEEWGRPVLDGSPEQPGQSAVSGIPSDVAALYALYTRHSYFVELDRGWYEPPGANEMFGAYHIAEKKREVAFNDNFPLRYGIEEGTQRLTSDYWRACPRARDFWYSAASPTIGQDFASVSAPDRVWKGMMHHSQFKCVQVVDEAAYASISDHAQVRHKQSVKTLQAPPDKNVDGSALTREQRAAYLNATPNSCATAGSTPVRGGSNPLEPVLTCAPVAPADLRLGQVLWAAVRINMDPSSYARGCLVQCPGQLFICPGADPLQPAQQCYQVCADLAASEGMVLGEAGEGKYRVRAEVPVSPVVDKPIGSQDAGYFIRQVP